MRLTFSASQQRKAWLFILFSSTFCASTQAANDLPRRKSGLWEVSVQNSGFGSHAGSRGVTQMCIDEKKDNLIEKPSDEQMKQCSRHQIRRQGDKVFVESVCKVGPNTTATSRGTFTGDFKTRYTMEIATRYDPPVSGASEMTTQSSARWIGPCPKDLRPGDVVPAFGSKYNMLDAQSGKGNR